MLKRIIQLKQKGLSNRKIADQLGIHRNSVNSYVSQLKNLDKSLPELLALPDKTLSSHFSGYGPSQDPRYKTLQDLFSVYERELKKVGCTYQTLWYGYKQAHPDGYGYTRFKHYLQTWLKKQTVSMHMTHKMADKLFVDFTGKKLSYIDKDTGEVIEVEVFVAVLGGSQYTYVQAVHSQQTEDLIRVLNHSLSYLGGVPQAIVCDNLKSAVDKSSKYEPLLNKNMSAFGLHNNVAILPARAYKPQDKSLVEGAVKLAYQRIFYPLEGIQFFSLSSLNEAIKEKLSAYNTILFQGRDYSRNDLFEKQERSQLQPLPTGPFQLKRYKRAKVQSNGHVWLGEDSHYYSVPHTYMGKRVEIQYSKTIIEIYYNHQRLASHPRSKIIGGYSSLESHMGSTHRYVSKWSAAYFIGWGNKKDSIIGQYMERMFKRRAYPEQVYKSCMGLQQLHRQYGTQRLSKACSRATEFERFGYLVIKTILKKGLDQLAEESDQLSLAFAQQHKNIRGAGYYE